MQPGDLVIMGSKSVGLFHIGIAIDNGEMIAADEAKGAVVVTSIPDSLYAALRPTLGKPDKAQVAPKATAAAAGFRCGARQRHDLRRRWRRAGPGRCPRAPTRSVLRSASPARMWSSGFHTGQDFPADIGTPVRAVTAGTVRIEHPSWAGNLVRIDHGNGLETLYAHLSSIDVATAHGSARASRSAPSAPRATRPGRTCTSRSGSAASR